MLAADTESPGLAPLCRLAEASGSSNRCQPLTTTSPGEGLAQPTLLHPQPSAARPPFLHPVERQACTHTPTQYPFPKLPGRP